MAKKEKIKKTPKQRAKKVLTVIVCIILVAALIAGIIALINIVAIQSNKSFISDSVKPVEYEAQLVPEIADNGCYTFVTDRNFKLMQLTDIHIGGGMLSVKKDNMALNAVAAMITEEKPDLVVVTGDISFPVPYSAGTLNNKNSAQLFADLMEKLGVYWCLAFGNHDTEAYSYYSREQIAAVYENRNKYPHCLLQSGPENISGVGNYAINIKNSLGKITQSLFMFDSHSYTDNDYFGILWKYDCIHRDQIEWYQNTLAAFAEENGGITPKSLCFFHIPPIEMRNAYNEYKNNHFEDTENVKYIYGKAGEKDLVVFSSEKNEGAFDAFLNSGSTQGIFFGHDHVNNISLNYKGLKMTYSYSIDYLAYSGISKFGAQRGCTIINVAPNGGFNYCKENYYQDKYSAINEKEQVSMEDYS